MPRRTRRALLTTLAGLTGLAGCTGRPGTPGGPSETPTESMSTPPGHSPTPSTGSPSAGTPAPPEPVDLDEDATRWAVQFDGPILSQPAVYRDTVVAGTGSTAFGTPEPGDQERWTLAALDASDGTLGWTNGLPAPTFGQPVITDQSVYVPTGYSGAYSGIRQQLVKVADGERLWATDPSGGFHTLLAVADDGRAFVGTSDDAIDDRGERLFAVDGADGSRVWTVESGDAWGGRLVEQGLLVDVGGFVLELRATADGSQVWRTEAQVMTTSDGSIPVLDGDVFVERQEAGGQAFGALDLVDGRVRWTFDGAGEQPFVPTGAAVVPEVTVGTSVDSLVVGTEYDGLVFALAQKNGGLVWSFETDGETRDGPVVAGDVVLLGDLAGTVYALDATDGSELWRSEVGGAVGWLGVAGDTVVVRGGKGSRGLVGLGLDDGAVRWRFGTDENLTLPALGDGVVVVGSERGLVRALGP